MMQATELSQSWMVFLAGEWGKVREFSIRSIETQIIISFPEGILKGSINMNKVQAKEIVVISRC